MNIKKFLMLGGVALSLGTTSCVGDLDLNPIDPNLESPESPTILSAINPSHLRLNH